MRQGDSVDAKEGQHVVNEALPPCVVLSRIDDDMRKSERAGATVDLALDEPLRGTDEDDRHSPAVIYPRARLALSGVAQGSSANVGAHGPQGDANCEAHASPRKKRMGVAPPLVWE